MLLALDTSGAVGAALHDGVKVVASESVYDPRRHAELLTPSIITVLREAQCQREDVSGIAVSVGPGPFTGLRVAIVTGAALAEAWDVPIVGVMALDGVAYAGHRLDSRAEGAPLVVATDARRREVYWAVYDEHGQRFGEPQVSKASDVPVPEGADLVGRGAQLYADDFAAVQPGSRNLSVGGGCLDPQAADLACVVAEANDGVFGGRLRGLTTQPLYLRKPDAVEKADGKAAT